MKQELLSIGEVAKMKGVGIKSLRYYERMGVLKPAYVDPESGYRYYSMNQMIDLDLIISSIELGIPLRELKPYLKPDGSINVEEMLEYGKEIAVAHLHKAESALAQIDDCLEEIHAQQKFGTARAGYSRKLVDCYALYIDWKGDSFAPKPYIEKITDLYLYAKEVGLTPLYRQGMLRLPGVGGKWKAYIEADVPKHLEGEWLPGRDILDVEGRDGEPASDQASISVMDSGATRGVESSKASTKQKECKGAQAIKFAKLPEQLFQGRWVVHEGFAECFKKVFYDCAKTDAMIIATEIWNAQLQSDSYVVELLSR